MRIDRCGGGNAAHPPFALFDDAVIGLVIQRFATSRFAYAKIALVEMQAACA